MDWGEFRTGPKLDFHQHGPVVLPSLWDSAPGNSTEIPIRLTGNFELPLWSRRTGGGGVFRRSGARIGTEIRAQ